MKLSLLVIIIGAGIFFLGYSKKADETWTLATPEGYAAPIPMHNDTPTERLSKIESFSEVPETAAPAPEIASGTVPRVKPIAPVWKSDYSVAKAKSSKRKAQASRHAKQRRLVAKRAR